MSRVFLSVLIVLGVCLGVIPADANGTRYQFWAMSRFDHSTCAWKSGAGRQVLTTPVITPATAWDQLIVSWNAEPPQSSSMEVWVRGGNTRRWTHWYSMGQWSATGHIPTRTSRKGQRDSDGEVKTDTLVLKQSVPSFQVRVVMNGPVSLRFLGVSLTNSHLRTKPRSANQAAWGRQLAVPGISQLAVPEGEGWCSPASVSMVLSYWAAQGHNPRWNRTLPQCADGVYDLARDGTGNWAFNAAYAGGLPGLKAYVTRLPDVRALEDWIVQGIPVVLSVSVDLHSTDERPGSSGHLIVCTGFTSQGDLIVNDPWTHLKRGEKIRRVIPRSRLDSLWAKSDHAVYIIHPTTIHPWQEAIVP